MPSAGEQTINQYRAAMCLARLMHHGQVDKAGKPYVRHVMRVGVRGAFLKDKIVGFLHDIVEDTPMTEEDLRIFFSKDIVDDVMTLTRREGEEYFDYIDRVCAGSMTALNVKFADLEDNMSPDREPIASLMSRYSEAKARIERAMSKHMENLF